MADDIFCKIVRGDVPAEKVYEDDDVLAFRDINAVAPTHILVIPKEHIPTVDDATEEHQALLGKLMLTAAEIARDEGIAEDGYRLVTNCNEGAGQSVFHIHVHLIGGRSLSWPPG